jgi:DNA replication and repair protein RecF
LHVEYLNLCDVRNIAACELKPAAGLNFIYGPNGQGKTNLVEAIHFLVTLDFHRGQASDFIRRGQSKACIKTDVEVEGLHRHIEITIEKGRSILTVDGSPVRRMKNYLGRVLAVAFFPEDMLILLMEPALRRRWLDKLIGLYHLPYRDTVANAKKALDNRNSLLREPSEPETSLLDSIDAVLAPLAAEIMVKRRDILKLLVRHLKEVYEIDFSGAGEPDVEYRPSFKNAAEGSKQEIEASYHQALTSGRERDLATGSTMVGPHRDDFILTIDSQAVRTFASRGEVRTALFSLNLAKLAILREKYALDPIIILDDVLSELDADRRKKVIASLPAGSQVFITSAEKSDIMMGDNQSTAFWSVQDGNISAV